MKLKDAVSELRRVIGNDPDDFLEIGRFLRVLRDDMQAARGADGTIDFETCLDKVGLARRRAAYWVEIDRVYGGLRVPAARLREIGWTKLGIIAKHIEPGRMEELLNLAEELNVAQLKARLDDREPPTRILAFHLTEEQYNAVAEALVSHGATRTGADGSLGDKEEALYRICKASSRSTTRPTAR